MKQKVLNGIILTVSFEKLSEDATVPLSSHKGDAGYDLFSSEAHWIRPKERRLAGTGLSLEFAEGFYGRIAPRSGMAVNFGIDVMAGVVDSCYRGEIKVLLVNLGDKNFLIEKGDRIAQIIFEKCHQAKFVEKKLDSSDRQGGGFGSTGT